MSVLDQFDSKTLPRHKIELHCHLDGAVRLSTIWDIAQKKKIDLKCKNLEELIAACTIKKPSTLANFLAPFSLVAPVTFNDPDALERISYEFCEDIAKQGVLYGEVRYCPHLSAIKLSQKSFSGISPRQVMQCILAGLKRGQKDFHVTVRSILCCFRGRPDWSNELLQFCQEFRDDGVVGIDIAGDEAASMAAPEDITVFQEAARLGIHRTAHAAEAGPATNAILAMDEMHAERVGHGYHVLDDPKVYQQCRDKNLHFETCPYSSYLTGSVPLTTSKHPIVKFAEDNINFSISRDDPFIIQKTLDEEYQLLKQLGLRDLHIIRANFNAARSCFLPSHEKATLINALKAAYGIDSPKFEDCPIHELSFNLNSVL